MTTNTSDAEFRERVAQLESTIAQGDDKKARAMDRQTGVIKRK